MPAIVIDSPTGRIEIRERAGAIVGLDWTTRDATPAGQADTPLLAEAAHQLAAYFAGRRRAFDLPLAPAGSAFRRRVWRAMRRIPYGQTRSYGAIAHLVGSAPRAVGGACGANPIAILVPCHRVVGADGRAGGFSGGAGVATKRLLLELETRNRG